MPQSTPTPKNTPKHPAKVNNPHPRHEHSEWHAPREGLNKAPRTGIPASYGKPHGRGG